MTTARWTLVLLLCFAGPTLLVGCGGGTCGGSAASHDACPPPVYGYALVQGQVFRSDGSPVPEKQVSVGCGDVVGAFADFTSSDGRFEVRPVYAVMDTILDPFPPRNSDGSFDVTCQANARVADDLLIRKNQIGVRFTPDPHAMVPTAVELREGSQ